MPSLEEWIERAARPGLLGIVGKALEKRCRRDLEAYFRVLGQRIVGLELGKLAEQENAEMARHAAVMRLGRVLRVVRPLLVGALKVNIAHAMLMADKQSIFIEALSPGTPPPSIPPFDLGGDGAPNQGPDQLGLSGQDAADYAAAHAADLVTGIDARTQQLIADAVAEGIEERLGVEGTARLIRAVVVDMTRQRSELIAQTEMNDAMSQAALRKLERLEIPYKRWILSDDPCPICEDNADEVIPVGDLFSSGDAAPPAHPRCRCAVAGARPPKEEGD